MLLIVMTPLWFWEEPTYWPDTMSTNVCDWVQVWVVVSSTLGVYEWQGK
jgi:hypothetical protein